MHFCVNPSFYSLLMLCLLKPLGCTSSVSIVNSIIRKPSDLSRAEWFAWRQTLRFVDGVDILSPAIQVNMLNVFGAELFRDSNISISVCSFSKRADKLLKTMKPSQSLSGRKYDFFRRD